MENQDPTYQQSPSAAPSSYPQAQPDAPSQYQPVQQTKLTPPSQPRKSGLKKLLWVVLTFVILTIAVYLTYLASTAYVITKLDKTYVMTGPSMAPMLNNGDKVLVAKYNVFNTKLLNTSVTTNDVVVFNQSGLSKYGQPNTSQLIKRVVAVAGQRVVIANDKLTVYDTNHPNGFDPAIAYVPSGVITAGSANVTVPSGDVYVLGDNRPDSLDSRAFGPVPEASLVGKVIGKLSQP